MAWKAEPKYRRCLQAGERGEATRSGARSWRGDEPSHLWKRWRPIGRVGGRSFETSLRMEQTDGGFQTSDSSDGDSRGLRREGPRRRLRVCCVAGGKSMGGRMTCRQRAQAFRWMAC